ncbi:MAG: DUF4329 domain-containing protein [Halieaceae bacterium]|jgi:hypothetical protein|nr:DUF4329 domain-containing protein [Halieaceae bacterium]
MSIPSIKALIAGLLLWQIAVPNPPVSARPPALNFMQITMLAVVASDRSGARQKAITADFAIHPQGMALNTPREAVMAFYETHDAAYLSMDRNSELAGFVLRSDKGQFFYTNAVEMPASFTLQARVQGPSGWSVHDFLHTHPGGHKDQNFFSDPDRLAVLNGTKPYYLRTPSGDVRFMDIPLAKSTHILSGARGKSICPEQKPCMTEHPWHDRRLKGDWASAIRRPT